MFIGGPPTKKLLTNRDLVRRTTEKSFKVFRKMDRNKSKGMEQEISL